MPDTTLVAYGTKHGSTREAADSIAVQPFPGE
jgi:menaquinone-dependent protoporphyrinogen IX oxidase